MSSRHLGHGAGRFPCWEAARGSVPTAMHGRRADSRGGCLPCSTGLGFPQSLRGPRSPGMIIIRRGRRRLFVCSRKLRLAQRGGSPQCDLTTPRGGSAFWPWLARVTRMEVNSRTAIRRPRRHQSAPPPTLAPGTAQDKHSAGLDKNRRQRQLTAPTTAPDRERPLNPHGHCGRCPNTSRCRRSRRPQAQLPVVTASSRRVLRPGRLRGQKAQRKVTPEGPARTAL